MAAAAAIVATSEVSTAKLYVINSVVLRMAPVKGIVRTTELNVAVVAIRVDSGLSKRFTESSG